jgi:hypothetical protein
MRLPFLFGFTALREYGLTLKRRQPPLLPPHGPHPDFPRQYVGIG